jgi:hypothetical protein
MADHNVIPKLHGRLPCNSGNSKYMMVSHVVMRLTKCTANGFVGSLFSDGFLVIFI